MSSLRAKCTDCGTFTAVALGPEYQCHACGREFGAGLVRVPKAWGRGGEAMVEAAALPLPYPETAVVAEPTLADQSLALALALPERPLVLGGCCCAHVGAVEGLAARYGRIGLIWFDAHGDLNTPETSPSGNEWGMPLRMLIDSGAVAVEDVALVGARNLDPHEQEFIRESRLLTGEEGLHRALEGGEGVYVAIDFDVFEDNEVAPFMPEPGGLRLAGVVDVLRGISERTPVLGAGLSAMLPERKNVAAAARLCGALGL